MERRNSGSGSGRKKLTPLRSDGTKRSSRGGGGDRAHADARELPPSRRGPTESGGRSRSRSMSRGTSAEGEIIDAPAPPGEQRLDLPRVPRQTPSSACGIVVCGTALTNSGTPPPPPTHTRHIPPGRRQRRNSTSGVTPAARSGVPSREVSSLDGFNRKSSLDVPIGMAGMPRTPSRGSLASLDGKRLRSSACRPTHVALKWQNLIYRFTDRAPHLFLAFLSSILVVAHPLCSNALCGVDPDLPTPISGPNII